MYIVVQDQNENAPKFKERLYERTIKETELVGTEVIQVEATDSEQGTCYVMAYLFHFTAIVMLRYRLLHRKPLCRLLSK